ncbi:MAG: hypothetical protein VX278_16380, partial [Myxococcota bacterium]|nr:hypothetical protein [Myxococcota bacterium]
MLFYLICACHTNKDHTPIPVVDSSFIEVVVEPPKAQIWINDTLVNGKRFPLSQGEHLIRVERNGFVTHQQELFIDSAVQIRLAIELEPALVPFHFALDDPEESLLIRSRNREKQAKGAFSGEVWAGHVEVIAPEREQQLLWDGWVDTEISLQRCTSPPSQKSICVAHRSLVGTPKSLLFHAGELWISSLTEPNVLQVYDFERWELKAEISTKGWGLLRERPNSLYFLRTRDSALMQIDPSTKEIIETVDLPGAWGSNIGFRKDEVLVSSWQSNLLVMQDGDNIRSVDIHSPRGVLSTGNTIWINSYDNARLTKIEEGESTVVFQSEGAFNDLF